MNSIDLSKMESKRSLKFIFEEEKINLEVQVEIDG